MDCRTAWLGVHRIQPVMYQGTLFTRGFLYFNSTFSFFSCDTKNFLLLFVCSQLDFMEEEKKTLLSPRGLQSIN